MEKVIGDTQYECRSGEQLGHSTCQTRNQESGWFCMGPVFTMGDLTLYLSPFVMPVTSRRCVFCDQQTQHLAHSQSLSGPKLTQCHDLVLVCKTSCEFLHMALTMSRVGAGGSHHGLLLNLWNVSLSQQGTHLCRPVICQRLFCDGELPWPYSLPLRVSSLQQTHEPWRLTLLCTVSYIFQWPFALSVRLLTAAKYQGNEV